MPSSQADNRCQRQHSTQRQNDSQITARSGDHQATTSLALGATIPLMPMTGCSILAAPATISEYETVPWQLVWCINLPGVLSYLHTAVNDGSTSAGCNRLAVAASASALNESSPVIVWTAAKRVYQSIGLSSTSATGLTNFCSLSMGPCSAV
eukprot:COSAG02_NODE_303_length_25213_cov_126.386199_13_plen_152_part_00